MYFRPQSNHLLLKLPPMSYLYIGYFGGFDALLHSAIPPDQNFHFRQQKKTFYFIFLRMHFVPGKERSEVAVTLSMSRDS